MDKVLVVGASSLTGKGLINYYLQNELNERHSMFITSRSMLKTDIKDENILYLDLFDIKSVKETLKKTEPDTIVYIASEGRIDYCENNRVAAKKINIDSLNTFIDFILNKKSHFIYISTNAVFDGKGAPYSENSRTNPINYYGETKLAAEKIVSSSLGGRYTIVRPTLLLGLSNEGRRESSIEYFLNRLLRGEKVKVVDDIYTNPLHTYFLAGGIWKIIENKTISVNEVFHFAGKDRLSRYELILKASEVFGLDTSHIEKALSSDFPDFAKRMPDTSFITEKAGEILEWESPAIEESLEILKNEMDLSRI